MQPTWITELFENVLLNVMKHDILFECHSQGMIGSTWVSCWAKSCLVYMLDQP